MKFRACFSTLPSAVRGTYREHIARNQVRSGGYGLTIWGQVHLGIPHLDVAQGLGIPVIAAGRREAEEVALAHAHLRHCLLPHLLLGVVGPGQLALPAPLPGLEVREDREARVA